MIMRRRCSLLMAMTLGATACGSRAAPDGASSAGAGDTVAAASAMQSNALAVRLERRACYGRCPEYVVELFSDGRVRYEGLKNVTTMGEATAALPVADVRALLQRFADAGFATTDSAYVEGSPHCGQYHTDGPHAVIAALIGSTLKSVHVDTGCTERPPYLSTLAAQVDSVARTSAWVGNGDAKK